MPAQQIDRGSHLGAIQTHHRPQREGDRNDRAEVSSAFRRDAPDATPRCPFHPIPHLVLGGSFFRENRIIILFPAITMVLLDLLMGR